MAGWQGAVYTKLHELVLILRYYDDYSARLLGYQARLAAMSGGRYENFSEISIHAREAQQCGEGALMPRCFGSRSALRDHYQVAVDTATRTNAFSARPESIVTINIPALPQL